jgi:hypothetical protein
MRLSDAGLRRRPTKLIYPDHRLPPWLNEDAARDRSNRLLDASATERDTRNRYVNRQQKMFVLGHKVQCPAERRRRSNQLRRFPR